MYNIGELIQDRFEIKTVLSGGMGMVYVCFDTLENTFTALKTLQDRFLKTLTPAARFSREAQTWITLGAHPHIVHAYKVEQIHGLPYIFMEYVAGCSPFGSNLRGWILHRAISMRLAIELMLQICHGLLYAQRTLPGLVHRDLKPENILITQNKLAKITDFGLVRSIDDEHAYLELSPDEPQELFQPTITRRGHVVGTPPYMSPEQCAGDHIDLRSDIYSLGCILYELLTGQWLIDSRTPSEWLVWHIHASPVPPSRLNPSAAPFDHVVLRCLEKRPTNRYPTFDDLVTDLEGTYHQLTGLPYIRNRPDDIANNTRDYGLDRALSFILLRQYAQALQLLEDILAGNPDSTEAWANKGKVLLYQERPHEALACFERALQTRALRETGLRNGSAVNDREQSKKCCCNTSRAVFFSGLFLSVTIYLSAFALKFFTVMGEALRKGVKERGLRVSEKVPYTQASLSISIPGCVIMTIVHHIIG